MKWLLGNGSNVNAIDRFHRTPLAEALAQGHHEVVQLLVESGGCVLQGSTLITPQLLPSSAVGGQWTHLTPSGNVDPRPMCALPPEWQLKLEDLAIGPKLGEGQFGRVFRATWNCTPVAAKVLKTRNITPADLRTEIGVLRRVHHPNVLQFLGASVSNKPPFVLVTELVHGGSLQEVMDHGLQLPPRRILELMLDCARGMAYLHSMKPSAIVHRDLKPANLMLAGSPLLSREELAMNPRRCRRPGRQP